MRHPARLFLFALQLAPWLANMLAPSPAHGAAPIAGDWINPPLALVSQQVELTVGRELTMVASTSVYQYVARDDFDHRARLYIHYPLYVETGLKDWREIVTSSEIKLEIGAVAYAPTTGGFFAADVISDFPVPEDAAVAYLVFEIPRELATRRFEARITHLQPNFHHRGALLAAYTPWLPKFVDFVKLLRPDEHNFEVSVRAMSDVTFRRYTAQGTVLRETPATLVVIPEHRKTIAVELPSAATRRP